MKKVDVAIIGAGPAGMAAAIELSKQGVTNTVLIERNTQLGGILNQCIHTGFGLTYYQEELTGPQYARKMEKELRGLNIEIVTNATVVSIDNNRTLTMSSRDGISKIRAKTILMATGCRERTRENIEVAGSRPSGVFNAGLAQKLINCQNLKIGKRVIIQGSGDIGLIMARRLALEGYQVIKVLERLPYLCGLLRNKIQCLDDFSIPLQLESSIITIEGEGRVDGVQVETPKGIEHYQCDTVLFSVGLIPELDLLPNKKDGIFICGNARVIHDLADDASNEAVQFAKAISKYLRGEQWKGPSIKKSEKDSNFDQSFFERRQNQLICTLCPKACAVSATDYGCPKGKDFFDSESIQKKRIITTTIKDPRYPENLALRSTAPLPLEHSKETIRRVLNEKIDSNNQIVLDQQKIIFQASLPWSSQKIEV